MLTGDLVHLREVPQVTCLGELDRLLAEKGRPAARELVTGFLAGEPANAYALEALLSPLAAGKGGAFLVSGLYGSGKSHLLAVVGLLAAAPDLWPDFARAHPDLGRLSPPSEPALVVALPLDEIGPASSLESLVFGSLSRALGGEGAPLPLAREERVVEAFTRYVLPAHREDYTAWEQDRPEESPATRALAYLASRDLPLQVRYERAEALVGLREAMATRGTGRVVILLDELGMHLAACPRERREEDAGFLQFLAQVAGSMPLLVVGAVQRALEDLGEIESHSLRQIRDRFRTLHLTCEHLRQVVATRLVERADPDRLWPAIEQQYAEWSAQGKPYFTRDDLAALYPLNPLALDLLSALAQRSLSQTRSLMQLISAAAEGPETPLPERPFPALLTPADLFARFGEEVLALPECAPQRRLRQLYAENWERVGCPDPALGRLLLDTLLLCSAAGVRWSVGELADSLLGGPVPAGREAVLAALEVMERFAGVRLERRPGDFAHLASLETESDHGELLRRRLNDLLDSFRPGDSRVWRATLASCREPSLPLATLAPVGTALVDWENTRRPVQVSVGRLGVTAASLANLLDTLAQPHCREWGALFVALPGEEAEPAWRAALPPTGRFSPALLCWLPRPLREREWATLCEHAAAAILLAGPMPREGRQGDELRALLEERRAWLAGQVAETLRAALWEGTVLDASGEPAAGSAGLAGAADFPAALNALFTQAWQAVYPQATACAPGLRWHGEHRNRSLLAGLVLPGACSDGPVLEQARAVMAPLGLVALEPGAAVLAPTGPAVEAALAALPEPPPAGEPPESGHCLPLGTLYGTLARSPLGLAPEQAELVLATLIRTGRVAPLDAFLQPVPLQADQPLRDYVHSLVACPAVPAAALDLARHLARAAFGREPRGQQAHQVWDTLVQWQQAVSRRAAAMPGDIEQTARRLGLDPVSCAPWRAAAEEAAAFAGRLPLSLPPALAIVRVAEMTGDNPEAVCAMLTRYRLLRAFLDRHVARAVAAQAFLDDPSLALPKGSVLIGAARKLLGLLGDPEVLLAQVEQWTGAADSFLAAYAREYAAWHAHAYGPSRYRPLLALRESPEWRALRTLDALPIQVADGFARVEGALAAAVSGHCAGSPLNLPESGPVCPHCRLALGTVPELPAPDDLLAAARRGISAYLTALDEPERRTRIKRALVVAPPPTTVRNQVKRLTALAADAPADKVAAACTPEAVEYIAAALRRRPAARRRSADLLQTLAGREMTKGDATRLFGQWLDPEGKIADGDFVAID